MRKIIQTGMSLFMATAVLAQSSLGEETNDPTVDIARPTLVFSPAPSDEEIIRANVFAEPLTPFALGDQEAEVAGENAALASALSAYYARTTPENLSMLEEFVTSYPNSKWNPGLHLAMGKMYRETGFFTKALSHLEAAWAGAKGAEDIDGINLADRSLGELADLNARFGRFERLAQLLEEVKDRPVSGSSATMLDGARQGYWRMTNTPAEAFRCGPLAVNNVLDAGKPQMIPNAEVAKENSSQKGTSLFQIFSLAKRAGFQTPRMVKRSGNAPWVVPSVIHLEVGHFAAITRFQEGRYLVKDPTYGGELWLSSAALNAETTGYALIDSKVLPAGWSSVPEADAKEIWGKGGAYPKDPDATSNDDETEPKCPPEAPGMAYYKAFTMLGTLTIRDIPYWYKAAYGPDISFKAVYNHLEANQPTFTFGNLGQFWTYNWLSYLSVDASQNVRVILRGGGSEVYNFSTYKPVGRTFDAGEKSQAVLKKLGTNNYVRTLRDGTQEFFNKPDANGRIFLTKVMDVHQQSATLTYDANFRLTSITDAAGLITTISYWASSGAGLYKIKRITEPFGATARYAEFTYDASFIRLIFIRDMIGITSQMTYAPDGFITKLTTPYGETRFQQYIPAEDGTGRGLRITLPDGAQECMESYMGHTMETYYWDRKAMLEAPGDRAAAETFHWLMDAETNQMAGVPRWTKKALEDKVFYHYPGQPDPVQAPGEPVGTLHYMTGTSNKPDSISRQLDDNTIQTYFYEYGNRGQITKSVDPLGRTFEFYYDVTGLDLYEVRQTRDGASEFLIGFTYNDKHQPLTMTEPTGAMTTYSYNDRGQITSTTNAKAETTTFTYYGDTPALSKGRLFTIDGPLSGSTDSVNFTYDEKGRVGSMARALGAGANNLYSTSYLYDNLNRVTQTTFPNGTTQTYTYTRLDLSGKKDQLGRTTQYSYDALQRRTSERDPLGRLTQYEWCKCGALTKLTDAMGRQTKWGYDLQGRLASKTYPDASQDLYTYEQKISRLKTLTDANGTSKHFSYNLDNTLASTVYSEGSGVAATPDLTYTYDPNYRRMVSVNNSEGSVTSSYGAYAGNPYVAPSNDRGRVSSIDGVFSDDTVSYGYDDLGRIIQTQINGSSNLSSVNFDAAGRVTQTANKLGTFTLTYQNSVYGDERVQQVAYPNGQLAQWQWYDKSANGLLQKIRSATAANVTLSSQEYGYDAVNQVVNWKKENVGAAANPTQMNSFEYDRADQLIGAVAKDATTEAILSQKFYLYDKAGNRVNGQADGTTTPAAFNNLNQLTSLGASNGTVKFQGYLNEPGKVKVGGLDAFMWKKGTNQFQFTKDLQLPSGTNSVAVVATDANTNSVTRNFQVAITAGGSRSFTYDANGNLLSDGEREFVWDAENRLVKIIYTGTQQESHFAYDPIGRRVKIIEKDAGTVLGEKNFVFSGMDIAEERDANNATVVTFYPQGYLLGSDKYFYGRDHLGSIREVADGNGAVIASYDYSPFGVRSNVTGTLDADFGYTGHYFHSTSGLILTAYRFYDPELGRWLSRDPIGEAGGDNLYGYVANNPINLLDPDGLDPSSAWGFGGGIAERGRIASGVYQNTGNPGLANQAANSGGNGIFSHQANQMAAAAAITTVGSLAALGGVAGSAALAEASPAIGAACEMAAYRAANAALLNPVASTELGVGLAGTAAEAATGAKSPPDGTIPETTLGRAAYAVGVFFNWLGL